MRARWSVRRMREDWDGPSRERGTEREKAPKSDLSWFEAENFFELF